MSPRRYSRFLKAVLLRQLRTELDHFRCVIDRDYFSGFFGQQLRERPFARAEIGHHERRQHGNHGMRQRLPGSARDNSSGRIAPRADRNIRAPCPAACARRFSARCDRATSPASLAPGFGSARSPWRAADRASRHSLGHNRRSCRRADPPPRRRVSVARDDLKFATDPSREFPAIPRPRAPPARGGEVRRSRVGSASRRRKLMVDAMRSRNDISTYHDWSICLNTLRPLKS